MIDLSADFEPVPAHEACGPIGMDELRQGRDGHVTALEGARVALAVPRCHRLGPRGRYAEIDPAQVPIQRPIGMPDQGDGFLSEVRHPDLVISSLRGAACLPAGVVLHGGRVLLESFSAPWEAYQHRALTRGDGGRWRVGEADRVAGGATRHVEGSLLWLDNQHIDWFGHVMLDVLTRAWAYEYCVAFLGIRRPRVACSRHRPFVGQLLQAVGISKEDLVVVDAPTTCDQLLVATKAIQIQEFVAPPASRVWLAIGQRLVPPGRSWPRWLYVSRRANPTRPLVEEAAIEALFGGLGFAVLYPEAAPIADQVGLFANARVIAGCSGSNMFNLAHARSVEAVLLFVSPLLVHYSEQFLLHGRGNVSFDVVIGHTVPDETSADPGYVHAPWHVSVPAVEELVGRRLDGWRRR